MPGKSSKKRGKNARTFREDLMKGEGRLNGNPVNGAADGRPKMDGLLMSLSSHPRYYEQKTAIEAKLGRELSNEEFERDYLQMPEESKIISGTSIFDPVLCELAYRWFCPIGGLVFDPFAGGSVRGIVAAKLNRRYVGIDLSERQLEANREQAAAICVGCPPPLWIAGDSRQARELCPDLQADFVFSCPPYGDLEVYSDDPRDLSTMTWPAYCEALRTVIAASLAMLKPDRFACFVVGDIRDADGFYSGLPAVTAAACAATGARLYNDAVLVTVPGSMPVRVGKQFEGSRKLGKTHQNVLVFCKGDPKKATEAVGPVEFDSSVFNDVIEPGQAESEAAA